MKPTKERLIDAAAALLDEGGESAVTLRAVGRAVGVSQNAPYRHFEDRSALLAAVAVRDFRAVAESFSAIRQDRVSPLTKLTRALDVFLGYGERFPARYRLLYSDPTIAARRDELEEAAMASFTEFAAIVQECQAAGELPRIPAADLAGLIFASAHGLVDLEAGGRIRAEKGLNGAAQGVSLLIKVLSQGQPPEPAGPDQSLGWSYARSLICSRHVAEVANAWGRLFYRLGNAASTAVVLRFQMDSVRGPPAATFGERPVGMFRAQASSLRYVALQSRR